MQWSAPLPQHHEHPLIYIHAPLQGAEETWHSIPTSCVQESISLPNACALKILFIVMQKSCDLSIWPSLDLSESKYVWKIYLWTHFKESLRNPSLVTGQFSLSRPVPGCWALAPGGLVTVSNYGSSVICHCIEGSQIHFWSFSIFKWNLSRYLGAWKCKHLSPKHQNAAKSLAREGECGIEFQFLWLWIQGRVRCFPTNIHLFFRSSFLLLVSHCIH